MSWRLTDQSVCVPLGPELLQIKRCVLKKYPSSVHYKKRIHSIVSTVFAVCVCTFLSIGNYRRQNNPKKCMHYVTIFLFHCASFLCINVTWTLPITPIDTVRIVTMCQTSFMLIVWAHIAVLFVLYNCVLSMLYVLCATYVVLLSAPAAPVKTT